MRWKFWSCLISIACVAIGGPAQASCTVEREKFLLADGVALKLPPELSRRGWVSLPAASAHQLRYRRQTAPGEWYEVSLRKRDCQKVSHLVRREELTVISERVFDDAHLIALAKKPTLTLVYLWSPRMLYSMSELRRLKKTALNLGIDFLAVRDSAGALESLPSDRALASVGLDNDLVAESFLHASSYLRFAHDIHHYPRSYLVGKQKVSDRVLVGVMPSAAWEKVLEQWRHDY